MNLLSPIWSILRINTAIDFRWTFGQVYSNGFNTLKRLATTALHHYTGSGLLGKWVQCTPRIQLGCRYFLCISLKFKKKTYLDAPWKQKPIKKRELLNESINWDGLKLHLVDNTIFRSSDWLKQVQVLDCFQFHLPFIYQNINWWYIFNNLSNKWLRKMCGGNIFIYHC